MRQKSFQLGWRGYAGLLSTLCDRVALLRYRQRRRGKDGVVVVECKEELMRLGMAMGDMI